MGEAKRAQEAADKALDDTRSKVVVPPKKKVAVTAVFHLEYEVPEDWDDDLIAFHIEENHCVGNYVNALHREMQVEPRLCSLCSGRAAAFVGHVQLDKIGALRT